METGRTGGRGLAASRRSTGTGPDGDGKTGGAIQLKRDYSVGFGGFLPNLAS
jgi:hypothetical protein